MRLLKNFEYGFRHAVVYPTLRLVFRNPCFDGPIDLKKTSRILILRYDRIGDMIVTTPLFRFLKEANPELHIGVFASRSNAAIIRHNPFVDQIYVLESNWLALFREIRRAKRVGYDVVLNFIFNRTTTGGLLANLIAPDGIKVGQGAEKYSFYFNRMLRLERDVSHMSEILAGFVNTVFGATMSADKLKFEIFIDHASRHFVDAYLSERQIERRECAHQNSRKYVVFNLTATDRARRLSYEQMVVVARHLRAKKEIAVVIVSDPSETELRRRVAQEAQGSYEFPESGSTGLRELTSLIEGAVGVVTPDTSIIHFASATQTPVLGFFTSLQSPTEWLPFNVRHQIVRSDHGEPVAGITPDALKAGIDTFIDSLMKHD